MSGSFLLGPPLPGPVGAPRTTPPGAAACGPTKAGRHGLLCRAGEGRRAWVPPAGCRDSRAQGCGGGPVTWRTAGGKLGAATPGGHTEQGAGEPGAGTACSGAGGA